MRIEYKKVKVLEDRGGKFRVTTAPFKAYKISHSTVWGLDKEWLKAWYALGFIGYEIIEE